MSGRDMRAIDELLMRSPRAPSVPAFELVMARARRRSRLLPLVLAAGLAALLVVILVRPDQEGAPAASAARSIDIGAGVALAAPSGDVIAVTGASSMRIVDPDGATLAASNAVLRYPRWLPDSSGLVGIVDRADAGVDVRLPLAVVERDGRVSLLGIDVPATSLAYLSISADGRSIALQDGAAVVVIDRAGGGARTIANGTLVGWDPDGRVLLRDGASVIAIVVADGSRRVLAAAGVPARIEARLSPDGSAAILVGPGAAFSVQVTELVPLPAAVSTQWLSARDLLGRRASGQLFAYDVRSRLERDLVASLTDEGWSSLRAVSSGVAVWFRAPAGEAHLVDLATGGERIVNGLSATSTFQPLADGRFLVTGRDSLVIGAR